MPPRHRLVLVALPLLALLDRGAFYGNRSVLAIYLQSAPEGGGLGLGRGAFPQLFAEHGLLAIVAPLLGGVLALAFGARIPLVLGPLLSVAGHAVVAASTSFDAVRLGWLLLACGHGLLWPALFTVLGKVLGGERLGALRAALGVLVYAALNAGAAVGTFTLPPLVENGAFRTAFLLSAGAAGAAVVVAGSVAWLSGAMARRESATAASLRPLGGVLAVTALITLPHLANMLTGEVRIGMLGPQSWHLPWNLLYLLDPAVIGIVSLVVAGLLGWLHRTGRPHASFRLMGAGSLVTVLAALPLAFAGPEGLSLSQSLTSIILGAAAEPLLFYLVLAVVCGVHTPLPRPLLVALLLCFSRLLVTGVNLVGSLALQGPLLALCSAGALVSALLFLVLRHHLWQWLTPGTPAAPEVASG